MRTDEDVLTETLGILKGIAWEQKLDVTADRGETSLVGKVLLMTRCLAYKWPAR